jgi:hypothetical protein
MAGTTTYFICLISNDADEIRRLVKEEGFCPVECSIGGKSLVDDLKMDHHGELSELEGVAVRAYRDHFGARKDNPKFVVTGAADADAAFAIAALAGLLPHPSREEEFERAPVPVRKSMTRDLSALAELVNKVDTDPIGVDLATAEHGPMLLVFNALNAQNRDSLGLYGAVSRWVNLTTGNPAPLRPIFEGAKGSEAARRAEAEADLEERGSMIGDKVAVIEFSRSWGFDIWYGRQTDQGAPDEVAGWKAPVVLALVETMGGITIGCPNPAVAESLFGKGGLKNVFPKLDEAIAKGWGGREAIGGSPRGMKMTPEQLREAARVVAELVRK